MNNASSLGLCGKVQPRKTPFKRVNADGEVSFHSHRLYRPETYVKRLEVFERAAEFAVREEITRAKSRLALARVRILRTLQSQIEAYRSEIEKLFQQASR